MTLKTLNTMRNLKYYSTKCIWLTTVLLILSACSEIFEGDLSEDTLVVISPSKDLETINTQIQFLWDELEDANNYHLRIASPSFANLTSLELDSPIVGNGFQMTLDPGDYEWRLQAKNSITASNTVSGNIHIDSTADISNTSINLLSPANQLYSNQLTQTFVWEYMYNADVYDFKLEHNMIDTVVNISNHTSENVSVNIAYDGVYTWEVIGRNNLSQTQTQPTIRTLAIDTYEPNAPSNMDPVDSSTIPLIQGGDSLVTFTWSGDVFETDIAPITDYIQVATSNAFQSQSLIYDEEISISTIVERQAQVKILEGGTYYWRVKSQDQAQNTFGYTNGSSFTINFTL